MTQIAISRSEFFDVWRNFRKDDRLNEMHKYVLEKSGLEMPSEEAEKSIRINISNICRYINERWEKSGRKLEDFRKKFESWLQAEDFIIFNGYLKDDFAVPSTSRESTGRPQKPFEEVSTKSKKRRLHDLTTTHSAEKLMFAAEISMRAKGDRNVATVLAQLSKSPKRVSSEMKKLRKQTDQQHRQQSMSGDEALAFYIDTK